MRAVALLTLATALVLPACEAEDDGMNEAAPAAQAAALPDLSTPEGRVADAMRAAPAAVAQGAQILDWPSAEGGDMPQLRAGTNGWTCFPTNPNVATRGAREPMCVDATMMAWAGAYLTQTEPQITGIGLSYMLAGDGGASNVDPYATGPTVDNDWVQSGPHVMMVVPDPAALADMTTDHASGGPYVMWKNTPWAHIMMPVSH